MGVIAASMTAFTFEWRAESFKICETSVIGSGFQREVMNVVHFPAAPFYEIVDTFRALGHFGSSTERKPSGSEATTAFDGIVCRATIMLYPTLLGRSGSFDLHSSESVMHPVPLLNRGARNTESSLSPSELGKADVKAFLHHWTSAS